MKPIRSSLIVSVLVISLLSGVRVNSQREISQSPRNNTNSQTEGLSVEYDTINNDLNTLNKIITETNNNIKSLTNKISSLNKPNIAQIIAQIFTILLLLVILGLNVFQFDESRRRRLSKDNSSDKELLSQQLNQLQNQLSEISSNISTLKEENSIVPVISQSQDILSNFSKQTLEFLNNFSQTMTSLFDQNSLKSNIDQDNNINPSELNSKIKVLEILINQLKETIHTLKTSQHDPTYNFQETNTLIHRLINELSNFSSSDQTNQKIIIDSLQAEVQGLREENTNLNNQIDDLKIKYEELVNKDNGIIKNLQSQLQQKEQEINYYQYQSQLGQRQQERDNLQSESQQQEEESSPGESSISELDNLVRLFNQDPQSLKNQQSFVREVSMDSHDYNKLREGLTQDVIFKNLSNNDPYLILWVNQTDYLLFFRDNVINSYNEFIAKYAFDSNLRYFPKKSFQLIKPAKLQQIESTKWRVVEKGEIYFGA